MNNLSINFNVKLGSLKRKSKHKQDFHFITSRNLRRIFLLKTGLSNINNIELFNKYKLEISDQLFELVNL